MNLLHQAPTALFFGTLLGLGSLGCQSSNPDLAQVAKIEDRAAYISRIEADRRERETFFRNSEQSPVPAEIRPTWSGLEFYPVDPNLRLEAPLVRKTTGREFAMATSTGEQRPCREIGYFLVDLGAGEEQLPVYEFLNEEDADADLFLPFTDATTDDEETYPAGRYLNVASLGRGRYLLDFNLAYNPYCAYGGAWDCPVAPPENHLEAAVRVGEKGWYRESEEEVGSSSD